MCKLADSVKKRILHAVHPALQNNICKQSFENSKFPAAGNIKKKLAGWTR